MTSEELITKIQTNKTKCYFISPHFDDAVFSAGYLMKLLAKTNEVTVVNVFTEISNPPYTLSARKYLMQCEYTDPIKLLSDRKQEDDAVLKSLNINVTNLSFVDAQWRKKEGKLARISEKLIPELGHVYPIYRLHIVSGQVSSDDNQLLSDLGKELTKIIDSDNVMIFCPIGIGNHVDHVLTRNVCAKNFKNVVYWADYPYVLKDTASQKKFISEKKLAEVIVSVNKVDKESLINAYHSQVPAISKNTKLAIIDESYFL